MKKRAIACCLLAGTMCVVTLAKAQEEPAFASGKRLFEKHCAVCHPNGGNVVNPKKTLKKKDRDANGISSADKLTGYMMNPGPGMPRLVHEDRELTKEQAESIAAYIIETFNGQ
ncbi:MAG: c-type cytochrome [Proteobacteria bacterium]|nr:c-type cytochrome [Pseudomonadota bacterium]